ncbi:thiamine phosphate synthase [Saliterribacillus persicus]|uniref:Thiamine-phosphate synthase n=1 Tax=Saliterribacillus persicus TaxID=930114 RepID=A0A368Y074_9BACI|nr:thiamine phosphate synthase [Saliterribacillus persicus]RCW73099.1 thiamine-phosphate diphosphorylase [Saliterribacillus persicus]
MVTKITPADLRVYFIMGSQNTREDPLVTIERALAGGVTFFQLREKGKGAKIGEEKEEFVRKIKALCKSYQVPFVINDDVELAIKIGADGVHVGQEDESIESIKKRCPKDFIIGVSSTNLSEAEEANRAGADYIGVGPIYPTSTKADAKMPIGEEGLTEIKDAVGELPVVAIGGIKLQHVIRLRKAGADGVSFISAICNAENPELMAKVMSLHASIY